MTDYERSRRLVVRAKEEAPVVAAKIAERAVSSTTDETPRYPGGRPKQYEAPRSDVAKALGVGETTLREAESHVAAVEDLGVPAGVRQTTVWSVRESAMEADGRDIRAIV